MDPGAVLAVNVVLSSFLCVIVLLLAILAFLQATLITLS